MLSSHAFHSLLAVPTVKPTPLVFIKPRPPITHPAPHGCPPLPKLRQTVLIVISHDASSLFVPLDGYFYLYPIMFSHDKAVVPEPSLLIVLVLEYSHDLIMPLFFALSLGYLTHSLCHTCVTMTHVLLLFSFSLFPFKEQFPIRVDNGGGLGHHLDSI